MFKTTISFKVEKDGNVPFCDCVLTYSNQDYAGVVVVEDALITGFLGRLLAIAKEQAAE